MNRADYDDLQLKLQQWVASGGNTCRTNCVKEREQNHATLEEIARLEEESTR